MNMLTLIAFVVVEIIFLTFVIVMIRSGLKDKLNKSFFYFLLGFVFWAATNFASNIPVFSQNIILPLNQILFFTSVIGLLFLLKFIMTMTHKKRERSMSASVWLATVVASVASFLPWTITDAFVDHSVIALTFGWSSYAYFAAVLYLCILAAVYLFAGLRHKSAIERSQARVLLVTIGLAIGVITMTNVVLPAVWGIFTYSMIGMFAGMFIIGGVSYSIVRHGMFDIKLAAVRSVTYSLVLMTLAVVYFALAFLMSKFFSTIFVETGQIISSFVISLILALIFQPVRLFFDRITNSIFYKNEYKSGIFFAELNRILVSTTDLHRLLERVSHHIAKTLKSELVFFSLHPANGRRISAGTGKNKGIPADDMKELAAYFVAQKDPIIQTSRIEDNKHIRRLLVSHRIELALGLMQGETLIGFLCLGEHRASAYSRKDLRVLSTIPDELVIAIQNALSVQEVRELNSNLEHRIISATRELRASNAQLQRLDEAKDEFISMASHQLRTPLTSIKGYLSMLIEGDVGEVTKEQKHMLNEAFISSERMVRLIGDFLNVSRLQTGKFVIDTHPVDLTRLVQHEVDSLTQNALSHGLKFVYKHDKNIPLLELDENKIQQVVMNFCDNAIYYSKQEGIISVSLKKINGFVEFKVTDNGIGVPKEEQAQLFNKFFRATNARSARPDGTGVGLFLAKKVIDDHKGTVLFESEEGKGSTFGFRLPLPKD